MFAIVLACILGLLVTASYGEEDGFVALMVKEKAGCGNGDEWKVDDDMSVQECADYCGGKEKLFFAHKSADGVCRCAGLVEEEGGVCGWSSLGHSKYNVYVVLREGHQTESWQAVFENLIEAQSTEIVELTLEDAYGQVNGMVWLPVLSIIIIWQLINGLKHRQPKV